jgi:hypothetical protein
MYVAEVACGNGQVLTATNIPVVETYFGSQYIGGIGTYAGACTYASAGIYTVRVAVSDEDGGTSAPAFYRYVEVYDPAGGFTTGSGFFDVPGRPNQKGHFTFDARFASADATAPNGTVTYRNAAVGVILESTGIDMLVVSGNRAQLWGTGTLNGTPVRFRITVVDGETAGSDGSVDAIRIEISDAAGVAVLYDTQPGDPQDAAVTTPTEGGTIRILAG